MEVLADVIAPTYADTGRGGGTLGVGGSMKKLSANLKLWHHLIGQNSTSQAEIRRADRAEHASTPSEGGPSSVPNVS
jgi:hypothetical protein